MTTPVKRRRVPVHGVLLLDKPAGMSSTQALAKAKWLLNAEKAGHTGTLDPFATGLLPLCFGEATKFSADLLDADKTYEAVVRLGMTTSTGDTEGEPLEHREVNVTLSQIHDALARFRGPQKQVPPMYSALKRDGKPLYAYAREGITLERTARDIIIHELDLLHVDTPMLKIRVRCSKATYIRVLGEDIGKVLGCGAHLTELRRTSIAYFSVTEAVSLSVLEKHAEPRSSLLLPVDQLTSTLPLVQLNEALTRRFLHGQRLALGKEFGDHALSDHLRERRVRVIRDSGSFVGTAVLSQHDVLIPERVISITS